MERSSRDFLRRFVGNNLAEEVEMTEKDADEIELSLGLSLGGCFGVDPKGKKLVRSSSIASFLTLPREPEFPAVPVATLARTSSLPTETEEELRKRKEMQSLKRLEAKRKRLERRNSIRSGTGKPGDKPDDDVSVVKVSAEPIVANGQIVGSRNDVVPPGLPTWAPVLKRTASAPVDVIGGVPPVSQGSIGSQGSCTTSASDIDGLANQALNSSAAPNPHTSCTGKTHERPGREEGSPPKQAAAVANGMKEMERKMMEKMPFVSTKGDGPNGRRIEGFLYKWKGEEVRIVCVCHGSFLTPAEFVKHAGGVNVTNPLRHIVVNSSPFSL